MYVLFSHYRPRDGTPENCFFLKSSYSRAYVCMRNLWKDKRQIPWRTSRGLNWENKTYKLKRSVNGVSVLKKTIHKQQLKETIGHVVQIDVGGFPSKRF